MCYIFAHMYFKIGCKKNCDLCSLSLLRYDTLQKQGFRQGLVINNESGSKVGHIKL